MGVALQDERRLRRIAATLVALAALAERAGSLSFPVRWLVLSILWSAEAVARTFVVETTRSIHFQAPLEFAGLTHMALMTPPPPPSAVPLPRFAGEDLRSRTAAAPGPPPFTGEGDHAKHGGGGTQFSYAIAPLATGSSPADAAWFALRFRALAATLAALLLFLCRFGRPNADMGGAIRRLPPEPCRLPAPPRGWRQEAIDTS